MGAYLRVRPLFLCECMDEVGGGQEQHPFLHPLVSKMPSYCCSGLVKSRGL
jgi:hypothetical protein